jgi:hypothetical protein
MSNLELLVKSLNKLENYTAKYIFKKYIETQEVSTLETATPATASPETAPPGTSVSTEEPDNPDTEFKYSKKPNSNEEYKSYTDKIFSTQRKHIITQNDILEEDLDNIALADDEYENDPAQFHRRQTNSYPDIKRCSFIRKHKNKLIRCKNSIINDDEDMCSRHEDKPNIYWDSYNELVDKISDE